MPFTGPSCASPRAAASTSSGTMNVRGRTRTRVSSTSAPRIAAVGGTRLASRAGTVAASNESGTPIASARATCTQASEGGAAAVAM